MAIVNRDEKPCLKRVLLAGRFDRRDCQEAVSWAASLKRQWIIAIVPLARHLCKILSCAQTTLLIYLPSIPFHPSILNVQLTNHNDRYVVGVYNERRGI